MKRYMISVPSLTFCNHTVEASSPEEALKKFENDESEFFDYQDDTTTDLSAVVKIKVTEISD